jgi:hypothetical protein
MTNRTPVQEALDIFAKNVLLRVNFCEIAKNDKYKTYAVRVPREACPRRAASSPD